VGEGIRDNLIYQFFSSIIAPTMFKFLLGGHKMKIGFLGPEGTFSEEASKLYLKKVKDK